jgi:hypothetical protein
VTRHLTLCALLLLCVPVGTARPPYGQESLVPSGGAAYSPTEDLLRQILDEMKGLRQDVRGLQGGSQQGGDGKAVLVARCLKCHSAAKGDNFVLLLASGGKPPFSLREQKQIEGAIDGGTMPKDGTLTEAEKKALKEFLLKLEDKK